jgi:hypothetical protein
LFKGDEKVEAGDVLLSFERVKQRKKRNSRFAIDNVD